MQADAASVQRATVTRAPSQPKLLRAVRWPKFRRRAATSHHDKTGFCRFSPTASVATLIRDLPRVTTSRSSRAATIATGFLQAGRLRARDAVDPIRGPRRRCRSHRWPRGNEVGGRQPILSAESHGEPVALVARRRRRGREVVAEGTSNEGGALYGGEGGPICVGVCMLGIDL